MSESNGNGNGNGRKKLFNPQINVGHIITACVLLSGLITGYIAFRQDIDMKDYNRRLDIAQLREQLANLKQNFANQNAMEQRFEDELKGDIKDMQNKIMDLGRYGGSKK